MRAACRFARELETQGELERVARVQADLYGSLALTGMGHGTDRAVLLGLAGNEPATIDPAAIDATIAEVRKAKALKLAGRWSVPFDETRDLLFRRETMFPPGARTQHPNGLRLTAFDAGGERIEERTFFSIGGGFIVEDGAESATTTASETPLPYPFHSAAELLETARVHDLRVDQLMFANECARLQTRHPNARDEEGLHGSRHLDRGDSAGRTQCAAQSASPCRTAAREGSSRPA
jgi:L-serine dehydratase